MTPGGLDLRARLERLGLSSTAHPAPATLNATELEVPGEVVRRSEGCFVLREVRFRGEYVHGQRSLEGQLPAPGGLLGLLGREPSYAHVPYQERAYLDTETSSLNSGAGVMVFLIGVGFHQDGDFLVRQYFMRHPGEERPLLLALGEFLGRFRALVTFHGKSFDVPRTRDRFRFQRQPCALPEEAHLDLCPASRRLFRHRFTDCRLQTLERGLLGFTRTRDLSGAECPAAWFNYQRGFENRIPEVMEHNLWDVLSLAVLEARVGRALTSPDDGPEAMVAGTLACEQGAPDVAREFLLGGLSASDERAFAALGLLPGLRAARALRRLGETTAAGDLLERLVASHPKDPRPARALAILEERDRGSLERALRVVEEALRHVGDTHREVVLLRARARRLLARVGASSVLKKLAQSEPGGGIIPRSLRPSASMEPAP